MAPSWRSLTAQLALKRHFHHVEWYLALAHTFDRHNQIPLQCLAVFQGDVITAIFPFRTMKLQIGTISLRAIQLASDPTEAQTARDFVVAPTLSGTSFFSGFLQFMAQNDPQWDVVSLPGILADSLAATTLKSSPKLPILESAGGAWGRMEFLTCGNETKPFSRLSKGFRQNLRTSHHKIDPSDVKFECASTEHDLMRLLPEFLKVESSGWKGEVGTSALKIPAMETFLRQLISQFGPSGSCEIHLMRVSDQPISALFGIVTDNIWYIFRIGYDEAYHRASPGHLIIENLLTQRSTQRPFNVLTPYNAPPWFHAWKPDQTVRVSNVLVFRPSPEGIKLGQQVQTVMRNAQK